MKWSQKKPEIGRSVISRPVLAVFTLGLFALVVIEISCGLLPTDKISIFWREFCQDQFAAIFSLFCIALGFFLSRLVSGNLVRLGQYFTERPLTKVAVICALSAAFYALLMKVVAFNHPFVPDEYCAVLQSQVFATGKVSGQVPTDLLTPFFSEWILKDFIVSSPKTGTFSPTYWPGYALLLTPFTFFGVPFLLNPLITAASLWLFFLIGRKIGGSNESGFWALLFALASPVVAINAATYFSMPAHLLANLLFCWLIIQDQKRLTFLAGVLGGFALVLHNPVPHATFAVPWIVWVALKRRGHLMPLLCGYAILALPLGIGWSSHLEAFRAEVYTGGLHETPQETVASGSTFSQVMSRVAYAFQPPGTQILVWRGAGIIKTIVWSSPALVALALLGWKRMRRNKSNRDGQTSEATTYVGLMCASLVFTLFFYLFVRFDQGHGWGFRYLHHAWLAIPILATYYLTRLGSNSNFKHFIGVTTVLSLLLFVPFQAFQARLFMQTLLDTDAGKTISALDASSQSAIVFVNDQEGYFRFTLVQNDPFLRNHVWKFRNLSPEQNEKVARKYLQGAKLKGREEWGEVWLGEGFTSLVR